MKRRYPLTGFIALAIVLIGFCGFLLVRSEIQRQKTGFAEYAQKASGAVRNQLDTNEAVLEGFSAFLQAVAQGDTEAAARYAEAVSTAYPNIYMLEVARAVPVAEGVNFQSELRRAWNPNFELKDFPSLTQTPAEPHIQLQETWPVLFMYPPLPQASAIYGVRLETVPYLSHALARSRDSAKPVVSPVFSMYEGGRAYILMRSVTRQHQGTNNMEPIFFGSSMVALLLIKTESVLNAVQSVIEDNQVGIAVVLKPDQAAESAVLSIGANPANWFDQMILPCLDERIEIQSRTQPMAILFQRQLRLLDVLTTETMTVLIILLGGIVLVPLTLLRHYKEIGKAQDELERATHLATHDALTGLPNRILLADRFEQAVAKQQDSQMPFAVLLIDLDHFKQINDDFGHVVGDEVLRTVAGRMIQATRLYDTVARFGGDEFVALVQDMGNAGTVENNVRRLQQSIEQPISTSAGALTLSCSIGVSIYPTDGLGFEFLILAADAAMYEVKRSGKNGVAMAKAVNAT